MSQHTYSAVIRARHVDDGSLMATVSYFNHTSRLLVEQMIEHADTDPTVERIATLFRSIYINPIITTEMQYHD